MQCFALLEVERMECRSMDPKSPNIVRLVLNLSLYICKSLPLLCNPSDEFYHVQMENRRVRSHLAGQPQDISLRLGR